MKLKINRNQYFFPQYEFLLIQEKGDHPAVAQTVNFEALPPNNDRFIAPTFTMPENEALEMLQALVNDAWDLGIRPQHAKGEKDNVDIKYHLEDMRKLVFEDKEI